MFAIALLHYPTVNKEGRIVMAFNGGVIGDSGQIVHDRLKPRIEEELGK